MAQNLRDRGYSSSMDGYTPKLQKQERHAREKNVVPGEAKVQKGQAYQPSRSFGNVPEYSPVYPGGNPAQSTPLSLQFTDANNAARNDRLDADYQAYVDAKKQLVPSETRSNLSMEDLKKRIDALNEAIWNIYRKRDGDTFRVFDMGHRQIGGDNPSYLHEPWENFVDPRPEYLAAANLAEYNWNVHDFLDDWMPDITDDPVTLALEQQAHANAAITGNAIFEDPGDYWDSLAKRKEARINADEKQYDRLVKEYRNLTNEYNVRLAQYLQGLR